MFKLKKIIVILLKTSNYIETCVNTFIITADDRTYSIAILLQQSSIFPLFIISHFEMFRLVIDTYFIMSLFSIIGGFLTS